MSDLPAGGRPHFMCQAHDALGPKMALEVTEENARTIRDNFAKLRHKEGRQ